MNISILLQNLVEKLEEELNKSKKFDEIVKNVRNCTDDFAINVIKEHVEELDYAIKESAERKKEWYLHRLNDQKTILTEMGLISFKRTYFKNKKNNEYTYLVDNYLNIDSHQRLDKGFQDKLIEEATLKSYENTTKTVGKVKISRQTVKRLIHDYHPDDIKKFVWPEKEKKKVEYLYIDADEDHVSVIDKKTHNQNILYVYEGKDEDKRNKLINAYYVTGISGKALFEEAWEHIKNNYDIRYIKRIYIQGDGAAWIKSGVNIVPMSRFVLDKFHLSKYINKCTRYSRETKNKLYTSLYSGDADELDVIMNEILESNEVNPEVVFKSFKYFFNNLHGITIHSDINEKVLGCSAEGHVSHILSARISSRPLTWSVYGANNISKLRVYLKNNGNIEELREDKAYVRKLEKKYKFSSSVVNRGKFMYDEYDNIDILKKGHRNSIYKILKEIKGIS